MTNKMSALVYQLLQPNGLSTLATTFNQETISGVMVEAVLAKMATTANPPIELEMDSIAVLSTHSYFYERAVCVTVWPVFGPLF